jgi:hypothetical protein
VTGNPRLLLVDEYPHVASFRLIFSPERAFRDVHDGGASTMQNRYL